MVLVDLNFYYGGDWIRSPKVFYSKKLVHTWNGYDSDCLSFIDIVNEFVSVLGFSGVQQLVVPSPFGKLYEVEGDEGIRVLLEFISDKFKVINLFAVDESELPVFGIPNIVDHNENYDCLEEVATDCSSLSEFGSNSESDSSDYDSDELELLQQQKSRQINESLDQYRELYLGMSFKDIPEARKFINLYAIVNKKGLKQKKSDRTRVRYECVKGCPFVCLISKEGSGGVKIKTLKSEHDCDIAYDNARADFATIAYYFKNRLQNFPKTKVKEMRVALKVAFELNVSHSKCKRAKKMILETLDGSFNDEYNKLEAYANALRESNPGSDVVINISKDALAEGKRKFLRMYICFNALKMGFKLGLRPFIGLDGTFLKGKAIGQILVAVGQDSMNHFYPIAWAIVDKETKRTWIWFMQMLQHSLELKDGEGFTFISYMQKGLVEAMKEVLPEARHRYCVRHIEKNWMKRYKSEELKKYLWWSAWATFEEDLDDQMNTIGSLNREAADALVKYPVQLWCRSYFDTYCKNFGVDNNFTESFNAWILEARYKPVIKMLEDIRIKVMNLLSDRAEELRQWDCEVSPYSKKLFDAYMRIAQRCSVNYNGDDGYEVHEGDYGHTVNFDTKTCTCRTWDLSGIPCAHAIKAMLHRKVDPLLGVHWWYGQEAYTLTYRHKLQPVKGEKFWKIDPSQAMEPPDLMNMAGRPRTKRIREKDEAIKRKTDWTCSRKGRLLTCGNCGQPNHNTRTCDKASKGKKPVKGNGASKGKQPAKMPKKGKQTMKRSRTLVDEDSEADEVPMEQGMPTETDEIQLTGPEMTQTSQSSGFVFMPTPGLAHSQQSTTDAAPFESHQFDRNADPPVRPKVISELKTRLQLRQDAVQASGSRKIKFTGDKNGISESNLTIKPKNLQWQGQAAVTGNLMEVQRQARIGKLKARRGNSSL